MTAVDIHYAAFRKLRVSAADAASAVVSTGTPWHRLGFTGNPGNGRLDLPCRGAGRI